MNDSQRSGQPKLHKSIARYSKKNKKHQLKKFRGYYSKSLERKNKLKEEKCTKTSFDRN